MNHSFNIEIAKRYGVEAAIIIENLNFWIEKNKANGKHFYEGQYWTYNSAKAFSELFPYWSAPQISRILKKLENDGILLTGNFNSSSYDRTKWYSLNCKIHFTKSLNGNDEIVNSYTDINTYIKPDINTDTLLRDFETFWERYPKKKDRVKALAAWKKYKPPIDEVMYALSWQTQLKDWIKEDGKFVKYPERYITHGSWQDEEPVEGVPF
jgi:hypothetical protein